MEDGITLEFCSFNIKMIGHIMALEYENGVQFIE